MVIHLPVSVSTKICMVSRQRARWRTAQLKMLSSESVRPSFSCIPSNIVPKMKALLAERDVRLVLDLLPHVLNQVVPSHVQPDGLALSRQRGRKGRENVHECVRLVYVGPLP